MDERYLIDSNVVIDFFNGKLPDSGRNLLLLINPRISIITNIELFATQNISEPEFNLLKRFVDFFTVHSVDKIWYNLQLILDRNTKLNCLMPLLRQLPCISTFYLFLEIPRII